MRKQSIMLNAVVRHQTTWNRELGGLPPDLPYPFSAARRRGQISAAPAVLPAAGASTLPPVPASHTAGVPRLHPLGYVPRASDIWLSFYLAPGALVSACNNIRTFSCLVARLLPLRVRSLSRARSFAVNLTNIGLLSHPRLRGDRYHESESSVSYNLANTDY